MIGAIIGDIIGSRFELVNCKKKDFTMFSSNSRPTDDSIMTFAVAKALTMPYGDMDELSSNAVKCMQEVGLKYPRCGFGKAFKSWLLSKNPQPYNSFGNGAAMRISPVGFIAKDIEEAKVLSNAVTRVSHNHPEGLKGAEAVAVAIVLARQGKSKEEIRCHICRNYYDIDFTLDEIRESYEFDVSCQGSVPQALQAFFESEYFEGAIRNAISIGGDSDTIAAITGGIAEAFYGVPKWMEQMALNYLDDNLKGIYNSCKDLNKIV